MTVRICCDTEEKNKSYCSKILLHMINCRVSYFLPVTPAKCNSPPHLKHVATLPCDLLLITMHASNLRYFPILMFHKVVQRHV